VLAVERDWEDYLEQFCLSLTAIFSSVEMWALNSKLLVDSLELLAHWELHYLQFVGMQVDSNGCWACGLSEL
jgi:hypothetical protein